MRNRKKQIAISETETCVICNRMLGEVHVSSHHLIPKSKGGTHGDTILIHHICHQKIHALFLENELKLHLNTVETLCGHEGMQKFIKWVSKHDPRYYQKNKKAKRK